MDGGIVGLGGFLDGIAALGLNGHFTFIFFLGNFTAGRASVPVP